MTSWLAHYGVLAVFVLMMIDAVFPAASELVMVYAGALASGALTHTRRRLRLARDRALAPTSLVVAAGVLGYQIGADRRLVDRRPRRPAVPRAPRPLAAPDARPHRPGRPLVRPLGRLGGLPRAHHARRALVHLDPGRRLRDAVPPLQRLHAARQRALVLRRSRAPAGRSAQLRDASTTTSATSRYAVVAGIRGACRVSGWCVVAAPATMPSGRWRSPTLTSRRSTRR